MRNIHLYLGCFFAPLLVFFVISGALQTFNLHETHESNADYKPPAIIKIFSEVHMHQRLTYSNKDLKPSETFRFLLLIMSFGLLATTALGVLMAFKCTHPWKVGGSLFLGVLIPCFLLWLSRG